ncbi:peptide-N4-asparagine amidase [Dyella sp. BiH032]|uniref:peptide-N4-asparagine amidase n=1 Tax=Dyella sp. BiH032 TaxID=3075430 RepID=UPI002892A447|nr:peptide-N4-asparagine amidase [Dyella sp. BiH032]WNL46274.1 peptide-N4-asparagine amidase [Dyella sp. BiH032]
MSSKGFVRLGPAIAGLLAALGSIGAAHAAAGDPPIGTRGVVVADPTVPRPSGTPCVVQLFNDVSFDDFNARPYDYAPPTGCQGRWSKVVLEADFSVTAGRQYDRTATLWLGGVNLYFGTTQEPSAAVSPSWHVERDLTDYDALLRNAGKGQAVIGNLVNGTYTGVIHGSARLLFYPASLLAPPAPVPDAVYPLGADPVGSTVSLNTSADKLSKTLTLPRNVVRAYLDVFAQSQGGDEFWYTCVPDEYAAQTQECGGGNFREAEVSIDGQPAGVAPVYPWIYTGGIDPYLWRPTPGVQTLNFMPYRVDLTPFAGRLSDGQPHEVAVNVAGAHGYFSATAALLVYRDPHLKQVLGGITRNTLVGQAPTPVIGSTLSTDGSGNVTGDVTTKLTRQFVIEGYAVTSKGRVVSSVAQTVGFDDTQSFVIDADTFHQVSDQLTQVDSVSKSQLGAVLTEQVRQRAAYPLHVDYNQQLAADGSLSAATTVHQGYTSHAERRWLGFTVYSADLSNTVDSGDTLNFDANGALTSHTGQHSSQSFAFGDNLGSCYRVDLTTDTGALTSYASGTGCANGQNRVWWIAHPDGSPDSRNLQVNW